MSDQSGVVNQGAGVLVQAAKAISAAESDLNAEAAKLRGQVEAKQARWKGAGGTAFFQFHDAWQQKEKKIIQILNDFSNSINATHSQSVQTDTDESSNYKKTMDRLG